MRPASDGRNQDFSSDPDLVGASSARAGLGGVEFRRRLRWLVFYTWAIPPVFGLSFILLVGVLTPQQMLGILLTPLEPLYILCWLAFAIWYFPRSLQPLVDWLQRAPGSGPDAAQRAMQQFPLRFWAIFLLYLLLAPASVVLSASLYTSYAASLTDLFHIELIALIVSIIVGLPIFFLILNLFGRAAAAVNFAKPFITIRTKVFLIGALVPLLIDTMLVQYYWARTGFFALETVVVWLALELLAIGGSLVFAKSFAQSLEPLAALFAARDPMESANLSALIPRSTDELGIITSSYRALLEELRARSAMLELNNRILRGTRNYSTTAEIVNELIRIGGESVFGDELFLFLADGTTRELVCVAHSQAAYDAAGHFRLGIQEQSAAVYAYNHRETVVVENADIDARISPAMREKFGVRASLAAPLIVQEELIGVMVSICRTQPHAYTGAEVQMMENLAHEAAIALSIQRLRDARSEAEAAGRKRDRLMQLLLKSSGEAIFGVDINGVCTFANPACLRMLGYRSEDDLVGKVIHDLIHHSHADGRHYPKEACRVRLATLAGQAIHVDDEVHWRADGSSFPVEYWAHPMLEDGKLIGTVVTFVDISDRKRAERAMLNHNRFLRTVASLNAVLVQGRSEQEIMDGVCRALVDEGRFRMAWIGLIESDGARVRPVAVAGADDGYLARADIRCDESPQGQGPTGTAIRQGMTVVNDDLETNPRFLPWRAEAQAKGYRSSAATPLRMKGRIIGSLAVYSGEAKAFGVDETVLLERLATDLGHALERRAAESALRDAEHRLRSVVSAAPVIFFAIDLQGVFLVSEGSALGGLGLRPGEVVGRNAFAMYAGVPEIIGQLKRGLAGETFVAYSEVAERIYEVHYAPVRSESGGLLGTMGIAIDDTARVLAERELQRHRESLEQLVAERTAELTLINRELEAFSYSVSHDLRAPLRGIDGFSQALLEDYGSRLDDTGRDYLNRVRRGAQRMGSLIDDLLALARVTRVPIRFAAVELVGPAREVVAELREQHPDRGVEIILPTKLEAVGDRGLLKVVLQNLIGNAWKYTALQSQARIEIGSLEGDGETIFFVRDNGVGFDMTYSDKLFTPFQRLHVGKEFEGSGIGLATVQRIVHRHGGRVWAEATVGEGAVFYFSLPHRQVS